jgi:hypothetical protein
MIWLNRNMRRKQMGAPLCSDRKTLEDIFDVVVDG